MADEEVLHGCYNYQCVNPWARFLKQAGKEEALAELPSMWRNRLLKKKKSGKHRRREGQGSDENEEASSQDSEIEGEGESCRSSSPSSTVSRSLRNANKIILLEKKRQEAIKVLKKKYDPLFASTAVTWRQCINYEQREVLDLLRNLLVLKFFAMDTLQVEDLQRVTCVNGSKPSITDSLILSGVASSRHQDVLTEIENFVRYHRISDFRTRVKFTICVGDHVPSFSLQELTPSSDNRAKKLWQRAMWAMRCGIIKKIGEARALSSTQQQKQPVGGGNKAAGNNMKSTGESAISKQKENATTRGEDGNVRERKPISLSAYHSAVNSTSIDMVRCACNRPAVFVLWASWDDASIQHLQQHLFPEEAPEGDIWEKYCRCFVELPTTEATPATEAMRQHKKQAGNEEAKKSNPQPRHRSKHGHHRADGAGSGHEGFDSFVSIRRVCKVANLVLINLDDDPALGVKVLNQLRGKSKFWTSSKIGFHSLFGGASGDGDGNYSVTTKSSITTIGTLQAPFPSMIEIEQLPIVMTAHPPLGIPPFASLYQPRFQLVLQGNDEITALMLKTAIPEERKRERVNIQEPVGGGRQQEVPKKLKQNVVSIIKHQNNATGKILWHELQEEKRQEIEQKLTSFIEGSDASLYGVMEISKQYVRHVPVVDLTTTKDDVRTFTLSGSSKKETDAEATLFTGKSALCLRGTIFRNVFQLHLQDIVLFLMEHITNVEINLQIFEPSIPLHIPLNEKTPEHKILGWVGDVSCCFCHTRIHLNKVHYFHCLHCPVGKRCFCDACAFQVKFHPSTHVMAKVFGKYEKPELDVLWGPSNVAPIPTMQGKLVEAVSKWHVGTYCNGCLTQIKGVRWKCLMCHDVDLCSICERHWFDNVSQGRTNRRHPGDHLFMRIPLAIPGDASSILVPQTERIQSCD